MPTCMRACRRMLRSNVSVAKVGSACSAASVAGKLMDFSRNSAQAFAAVRQRRTHSGPVWLLLLARRRDGRPVLSVLLSVEVQDELPPCNAVYRRNEPLPRIRLGRVGSVRRLQS